MIAKVYKVLRGTKALGLRRGMFVLVMKNWETFRPGEIWVGRVSNQGSVWRSGRRYPAPVWVQDGDPAWDFEEVRGGWGNYAFTHGGHVFKARCGLAHSLKARGYPRRVQYQGALLEEASPEEVQKVMDAFERN